MYGIETKFKISLEEGRVLANYFDKEEFLNDCIGDIDTEWNSEIFRVGTILNWQNQQLMITGVDIQLESLIEEGKRIVDVKSRNSKTNIIVTMFVKYK
ncbi:hypothetical protein [uncultured Flavobacterium sp.]|uniref:hypothetical protein n=1 Tax=uncultured Flavobacterium sp. TaxID=165435 RepID=UPI002600B203|nr:hypothetical protein [uncultured Flavobacterium sp.]